MEINDRCGTEEIRLPISAIILSYNEEKNIEDCLQSVCGWVQDIFVVDSYSTDKTLELAKKYTDKIYRHPFENYARQRNWALENLPIGTEWILNLDADHRVTRELRLELKAIFSKGIQGDTKGFLSSRRTIFMGKWIRHGGHYPVYHAILFRQGFGVCEDKLYDQHFVVRGDVKKLKGDIVDIITDSLSKFVERHNKWATLEAMEQLQVKKEEQGPVVKSNILGHEIEKRRFLRNGYWKFPLFIRCLMYFVYRYFIRLGFLDGKEGLIFHTLQGFWYRFLTDAKIYEISKKAKSEGKSVEEILQEEKRKT